MNRLKFKRDHSVLQLGVGWQRQNMWVLRVEEWRLPLFCRDFWCTFLSIEKGANKDYQTPHHWISILMI
jgi:hypothetical protein